MDIQQLKAMLMRRRAAAQGLVVAGLFASAGFLAVQVSDAATYAVDGEAEAGTIQTPASSVSDGTASGSMAVRFQAAAPPPPPPPSLPPSGGNFSLRFFGTQTNDIDRVKIPLTPNKSIDVGGDFTLEWWMKTAAGNTMGGTCQGGAGVGWIYGNIIWDRDVDGPGDIGDYGISLFADGRLAFGAENSSGALTVCSTATVNDGQWHHVAVSRASSDGRQCIYIDGTQRGCGNGPAGDLSYRDGRATGQPNSDPFLVIAAEKHDYWSPGQGYHGWVDEARMSTVVRYIANFSRPAGALAADANTAALYHFDSGSGTVAVDVTGANNGTLKVGGSPVGPVWSTDAPF